MTPPQGPPRRRGTGTKGVPREQRERQILDAAAAEFGERGYAGGSVERIAAAVGVSRGMVHTYFDTKDGLYRACLEAAGEELVAAVAAAQGAADPFTRAMDTLRAILGVLEHRPHDWAILYDPTLSSALRETARGFHRRLVRLGATGVDEVLDAAGDPDPVDRQLLTHLWLDTVSSMVRWWLARPEESADSACERATRILLALAT